LVHRHALGPELVPSQHLGDTLAGLAVLLEAGRDVAPLVIEHDDLRAPAELLHVAERTRLRGDAAARHARPAAIAAACFLRHPLVRLPQFRTPLVVPHDPLAVTWIVPVRPARYGLSGFGAELALAVLAVTDGVAAHSGPTVVRDPLGMRALDD